MASVNTTSCDKRPLGCLEYWFAKMNDLGMPFSLAYTWHLESASPLSADLVHQAAEHLQRTMPLLRMHVVYEANSENFVELLDSASVTVPFELSSETDWRKVQDEMVKVVYDLQTGPVWKICFLPSVCDDCPPLEDDGERKGAHRSAVVFGMDHIMTDGFTNLKICKQFLEILNAIIDGERPDKFPVVKLYSSLVDLLPKRDMTVGWKDHLGVAMFRIWNTLITRTPKPNTIALKFPLMEDKPQRQTLNILTDGLTVEETDILRKMCKIEQTTVNGALNAAANTATVWMVYGRDKIESPDQQIRGTVENVVNMRRFCETDEAKEALGILFQSFLTPVALSSADHSPKALWDAARRTSSQMHRSFENREPLMQLRMANLLLTKLDVKSSVALGAIERCFAISNMGDCSGIVSGDGKHVQVTDIARSVSLIDEQSAVHFFHTFRGRLRYNLSYNARRFTPEQGQQYASWVLELIRSLIAGSEGTPV